MNAENAAYRGSRPREKWSQLRSALDQMEAAAHDDLSTEELVAQIAQLAEARELVQELTMSLIRAMAQEIVREKVVSGGLDLAGLGRRK